MITEYRFDKLNVGGSVECLLHSFINDEQVLLLNPIYPFELSKNITFSLVSRESALISNNLLLMVSTIVVFIGTLWPLLIEILID